MLAITNMDDVIKVVSSIKRLFDRPGGFVILLAVAVMVGCRKMKKSKKYLVPLAGGSWTGGGGSHYRQPDPDRPHVLHGLSGYGRW